jgi:hypothetical protein
MCMRAKCRQCSKVTYSGCGKHLDKVFRGLEESELCKCRALSSQAVANAVRAIQEGNANAA